MVYFAAALIAATRVVVVAGFPRILEFASKVHDASAFLFAEVECRLNEFHNG
jgi:hypothetical protein